MWDQSVRKTKRKWEMLVWMTLILNAKTREEFKQPLTE